MRVVYLAHPYGGLAENRERAKRWFRWAAVEMRVSPVADWIVMTELLDESFREFGLECDVTLVRRCDEVWLVGGEVSAGMRLESAANSRVRDMTGLGPEPPAERVPLDDYPFMGFDERHALAFGNGERR